MKKIVSCLFAFITLNTITSFAQQWESKWIKINKDGKLQYIADEKGNTIPDFSQVGYFHGNVAIPEVPIAVKISPSDDAQNAIQTAIDFLSKKPLGTDGFRGTILLTNGVYKISGTLKINASGIVLRGEGDNTKLIATGTIQRSLISFSGNGNLKETPGTKVKIIDEYVPVGAKSFSVSSVKGLKLGDNIIVFRPGTNAWIKDLKMDQIDLRDGTKQWQANEYNLQFERTIIKIEGNKIYIDNPVVLAMETKYGGGEIYKYTFERISKVGIENLYCES